MGSWDVGRVGGHLEGGGQNMTVRAGGVLGDPRVQKKQQLTAIGFIPENSYSFLAGITDASQTTSAEM